MATSVLRRWGRSLAIVIPREEVLRKRLRAGQRVDVIVRPLGTPDDFGDLAGTVRWEKTAQEYKDELRVSAKRRRGREAFPTSREAAFANEPVQGSRRLPKSEGGTVPKLPPFKRDKRDRLD